MSDIGKYCHILVLIISADTSNAVGLVSLSIWRLPHENFSYTRKGIY